MKVMTWSSPSTSSLPFQCTICSKRFSTPFNLKRHTAERHKRKREYRCTFSNCRRATKPFSRAEHLTSHTKRCHPSTDSPCPNAPSPMECEYPSCTTSMLPEAYVQHLIDLHGFKGLSNLAKSSREPLPRPSRLNPVTGESDESLSSNSSVSLSKLDERVNAIDEFVSSHFERLQNESPSNEKDRSPFEGNGTAIRDRFLLSGPSDLNMSQPTFRTELKKRNDLYLFDIGSKAEASLMRLLSEYMQHAFAIDGIEILAQCRSATWELMVLPFGPGSGGIWLLDKDLTCMRLAEWSFSRFLSCLKQRGLSDLPHYASWCPTRRESTEELRCWLEDELRHYTSDYFAPYSTKGPEILSRMKARAEDFNEPVNISNALRRFYSL